MSTLDVCPTCNASGDADCVTKSGAKAKKRHANRPTPINHSVKSDPATELVHHDEDSGHYPTFPVPADIPAGTTVFRTPVADPERETQKQRWDRMKREDRAAYAAKKLARKHGGSLVKVR